MLRFFFPCWVWLSGLDDPSYYEYARICMISKTFIFGKGAQKWRDVLRKAPVLLYRLPKMGVPPNHEFIDGISLINHSAIGYPHMFYWWNPHWYFPTIFGLQSQLPWPDGSTVPHDMGMGHGPQYSVKCWMQYYCYFILRTKIPWMILYHTISLLVIICHHESV